MSQHDAPTDEGVCAHMVVVIEEACQSVLVRFVHQQPETLVPDRVPAVVLYRALQTPVRTDVQPVPGRQLTPSENLNLTDTGVLGYLCILTKEISGV